VHGRESVQDSERKRKRGRHRENNDSKWYFDAKSKLYFILDEIMKHPRTKNTKILIYNGLISKHTVFVAHQ
jgi:hypothetical protein